MCLIYLELLELKEGLKVLEVGGGSGYHAALVAEVVSPTGKPPTGQVFTIERKPSLVEFAKANLERAGYSDRVTVIEGDGTLGYPAEAPFDRIMVAAAAPDIPPSLIDQLKPEGIMIIPVGRQHFWQELTLVTKDAKGEATKRRKMSVAFVPLIGKEGWSP
jgi:protein-L-isoaspartate(D-aspartate) O-methyltransferase